jgi:hypothetical protein
MAGNGLAICRTFDAVMNQVDKCVPETPVSGPARMAPARAKPTQSTLQGQDVKLKNRSHEPESLEYQPKSPCTVLFRPWGEHPSIKQPCQ